MLRSGAEWILSHVSQVPAGTSSSGDRTRSVWHACGAVSGHVWDVGSDDCQRSTTGSSRNASIVVRRSARRPISSLSWQPPDAGSSSWRPSLRSLARSTRCSCKRASAQKALPGDRVPDRAGDQRPPCLPDAGCFGVRLLRLEGPAIVVGRLQHDTGCWLTTAGIILADDSS